MADVRALLRNERLARRINHPYASYTTSGTLSCTVCNLRLQADSLWEPHLAGKVHKQNLQRAQAARSDQVVSTQSIPDNESNQLTNGNARKRKADGEEEEQEVQAVAGKKRKASDSGEEDNTKSEDTSLRKKAKPVSRSALPAGFFDGKTNEQARQDQGMPEPMSTTPDIASTRDTINVVNVDEDEYAAFEAAIAAAPHDEASAPSAIDALRSGGDIAAAPMTAAELAAQEAENLNAQRRGRKEEEIEGEKEDAARALEEEFDEMDELEARVKKLRDMRERLRTAESKIEPEVEEQTSASRLSPEDSEEDDDYEDEWGFR